MLSRLGAFILFIIVSVLAGAIVAAGALPAIAALNVAADVGKQLLDELPDELRIEPLAGRNNLYTLDSAGQPQLMAVFYAQNRVEVPLEKVSDHVKNAAVAAEDPRFYEHKGVDVQAVIRAAVATASGDTQGGSTITQQYVKNVLVQQCEALPQEQIDPCYDEVTATSPARKLREMRLALSVEKTSTKEDILRGYLNIAGFGGTVYGIEAAANYYYGVNAANLTLPQAASLIAIVHNPQGLRLDKPGSPGNGAENGYQANRERRDYVLARMLEEGMVSQAEHDEAVLTPVTPQVTAPTTGCEPAAGAAFFCDWVTRILLNDPTFGDTSQERAANFRRGGMDIYTTLDADLQQAAEQAVTDNVPATWPGWDLGGVITSVEVGTGRVLAMAQNRQYSQDPDVQATGDHVTGINYNTDFADGGSRGFQPGSTYKVFTLAEWLKDGNDLYDTARSARRSDWGTFHDSCLGDQRYPGWNPGNDGGESGWWYSAMRSTIDSINTGYVGMAKELDLCKIRKTAEAFGVHRADGKPLQQGAASVLGTNEIAPITMVSAFAGIANGGEFCAPRAIDRIIREGVEQPIPNRPCTQAVPAGVASDMTKALRRVMSEGTGNEAYWRTEPWVPVLGKTGTTDGSKDTWMTGASSRIATVAGVVTVNGDANQRSIRFPSGPASTARHRMWAQVMSVANQKFGGEAFPASG